MAKNPHEKEELHPKIVLGVAAHPDDLDYAFSGTVATWASEGAEVYYLILTNGNKGSSDISVDPQQLTITRRAEQRAAAKVLGVKEVFFCDYEDGLLEVSPAVKRDIVRIIRSVKPEVILTMDPGVLYAAERGFINHPDHRAAGQATLDAVFPLARDHLSFPELLTDDKLQPHKVATVLLLNFEQHNFSINISGAIDQKMAALAAHASQMPDLKATQQRMRDFAAQAGSRAGVEYAEAFVRIDIPA
jgi:LmbE family N-acetylglucosaminyl deacetylase